MVTFIRQYPVFKKFIYISLSAHVLLFLLIVLSPRFPSFGRKRMVHYVSLVSFGGGGGGGGSPRGGTPAGGPAPAPKKTESLEETSAPVRETLHDLTTPQKLEQQSLSSLRYPVEKPRREAKPPEKKKAVIQQQESPATKSSSRTDSDRQEGTGSGSGSGVSLGLGPGTGGGLGLGSEFSSQIGLSNFPFTYYLENMIGRISSNWLKTQISSGTPDELFTEVMFKIYRDGKISIVEIEKGSGIQALDLAAVRAVQSAAPFAPLPDGYEEEYLVIHLRFEHKK